MNIHDYICEFQQKYYRFREVEGELPDKVLACMLLSSCQLSEEKNQLVKTGLASELTMADMVSTLKRVFGNETRTDQSTVSQSEPAPPVFYAEDQNRTEDTLYTARSREYDNQGNYGNQGRFPPPVVVPKAGVGEGSEDRHYAIVHLDVIELTH